MKNTFKYIALAALGLVACEPEFDNPIDESGVYVSGEADFSTYVALGNSLTAGFADNALYITGQENSFPNILAEKFALAGGGEFTQPLMSDNVGGFADLDGFGPRLVLAIDESTGDAAPLPLADTPSTNFQNRLSGSFNNMGVPGAKSYHLDFEGYGNSAAAQAGMANPYFARFASSDGTSILADALAQNPTFFSLWIGNNDILGYATSGGVGEDHNETGITNPELYGSNDITNINTFNQVYTGLVTALSANDTEGVLINLPDVTSLPFFTTVPNNALVLDEEQAGNLTGFFQAFAGIATQVLITQGFPPQQAQAVAAQYAISFSPGPNNFLIKEEVSQTNPFGFRQMTSEELLLLTINSGALAQGYGSVVLTPDVLQVLGILQAGGIPTAEQANLVITAVSAINDEDVLDSSELSAIENARSAFNATIKALADANGLAYLDIASVLSQAATTGIEFDGGVLTSEFATGGGFSLDGVHPTPRAHALVANGVIDALQATYGTQLPKANLADYGTITLSNNVN